MSLSSFEVPTQGQLKVIEFETARILSVLGIEKVGHAANNPSATRITQARLPIENPTFVKPTDRTLIPVIELSEYNDSPNFANWRIALQYSMQDENAFRLAVISEVPRMGNGYFRGVFGSWGGKETPLSRSEADDIIADLDTLRSGL